MKKILILFIPLIALVTLGATIKWYSDMTHAASLAATDLVSIERPAPHGYLYATLGELKSFVVVDPLTNGHTAAVNLSGPLWVTNGITIGTGASVLNLYNGADEIIAGFAASNWFGNGLGLTNLQWTNIVSTPARSVGITIDGGGSAITSGVKGFIEIPYSGTITRCTMLADQSGSATVNIWKDTYANFPPTSADAIGTNSISLAVKNQDTTLENWTKTITAGDIIAFNVSGTPSAITRLHVILTVQP